MGPLLRRRGHHGPPVPLCVGSAWRGQGAEGPAPACFSGAVCTWPQPQLWFPGLEVWQEGHLPTCTQVLPGLALRTLRAVHRHPGVAGEPWLETLVTAHSPPVPGASAELPAHLSRTWAMVSVIGPGGLILQGPPR